MALDILFCPVTVRDGFTYKFPSALQRVSYSLTLSDISWLHYSKFLMQIVKGYTSILLQYLTPPSLHSTCELKGGSQGQRMSQLYTPTSIVKPRGFLFKGGTESSGEVFGVSRKTKRTVFQQYIQLHIRTATDSHVTLFHEIDNII